MPVSVWKDAAGKQAAIASYQEAVLESRPHVARGAYQTGTQSVSVRDGHSRDDYDYFRPGEELPVRDKDIQAACRTAYRRFPIVRSVVDMMVDFVVKGVDVVHPSPRVQKFGREWFKSVKGKGAARKLARNLFRAGAAPFRRKSRPLPQATLDGLRKLGHAAAARTAIPAGYTFLNPASVEALGDELNPLIDPDATRYAVRVPTRLKTRLVEQRAGDTPVLNTVSKDVLDALRGGQLVPLDPESTGVVHLGKDDDEVWATPILYPLLDDLQMLVKLKSADRAALDGAVSNIRVWNLGDLDKEIIPTAAMIAHLSNILASNVGGGVMDLVWGPDLKLQETSSNISSFLGIEKYVSTLAAIFQGLGIPPSLAGMGDGGGFTNNFVSLRVLVERLEHCRDVLVEFFEAELARVQKAFGFREPFRLTFDIPSLSDDAVEKKLLIDLLDRDVVSAEMVVERFGGDPDIEEARVRRDVRRRTKGSLPPKAGAYHDDSRHKNAMDRIFAQQGETTPSEHGVELRPKKAGEKPVNDKEGARQKKLAAAKPQPGEAGRPNGAKDMNGRRPKRVVPKQAVGETVVWAIGAREELAAALRPGFLEMRGKASVRSLSDADAKVLDRLVFAALCQVPPHTAPDPDAALAAAAVPPAVDALYRQAVANHTGVLTADADRRYQALAVALAAAAV